MLPERRLADRNRGKPLFRRALRGTGVAKVNFDFRHSPVICQSEPVDSCQLNRILLFGPARLQPQFQPMACSVRDALPLPVRRRCVVGIAGCVGTASQPENVFGQLNYTESRLLLNAKDRRDGSFRAPDAANRLRSTSPASGRARSCDRSRRGASRRGIAGEGSPH